MKASCVLAIVIACGWAACGAAAQNTSSASNTSSTPSVTTQATSKTASTTAAHETSVRHARARRAARRVRRRTTRTRTTRTRTVRTRTIAHRSVRRSRTRVRRVSYRRHRYYERYTASSFVTGKIGLGDITGGEDPVVRQAAIDALGDMNGTVVVIDPSNGRILAMVNQKLALSPGAEPCSTIKLSVALAALSEGLVTNQTMVQLPGFRMNMTEALAHSNNLYFATLGRELGFERVRHYAMEFGLGELAGYHIAGEQLGEYPDHPIPASQGGVGKMCSFGQGVSMTPLQLGALVAAIANGGTLYYLQHPTTPEQVADFQPRIKRVLPIAKYIPEVESGMAGAVDYGTARSLRINFRELPVFGKTGTCSNDGTRFGWFTSISDSPQGSLVTVFLLEGGRATYGPRAADLTGVFYRDLWDHDYFEAKTQQAQGMPPAAPQIGQPQQAVASQ